uniref:Ras-related protein Rab-24 n=1 Tax=Lygus hesperus TaxID=30085 RepID=A0A0K8TF23_LYGHE
MNKNGVDSNQANVKVVIIGNSDVGKTALMERFVYEKFSIRRGETLGATFVTKKITRGRQTLVLSIWDTAGTERYRAMMKQYYRKAKAAVVCYDITNKVSLEVLKIVGHGTPK